MGGVISAASKIPSVRTAQTHINTARIADPATTSAETQDEDNEVVGQGNNAQDNDERNLLTFTPRRGRSSTIRTSLRGLLERSDAIPQRKSLLGE